MSDTELVQSLLLAIKNIVYKETSLTNGKENWCIGMEGDSDVTDIVGDVIKRAEAYLAARPKVNYE